MCLLWDVEGVEALDLLQEGTEIFPRASEGLWQVQGVNNASWIAR